MTVSHTTKLTRFVHEGPPVRFSDFQRPALYAPPTLGQHTYYVLEDIRQLDSNDIEQLRADGVIQ